MIVAEAVFTLLNNDSASSEATSYQQALRDSWIEQELYTVRNIRPSFRWGLLGGMAYSALETYALRGKAPWTLPHHEDKNALGKAADFNKIHYPRPDSKISFDRPSSVFLSTTNHAEGQSCHLQLEDPDIPTQVNPTLYDAPEQRYCPAGVYEIVEESGAARLQIYSQNCVH